jgi:hypothetical protein
MRRNIKKFISFCLTLLAFAAFIWGGVFSVRVQTQADNESSVIQNIQPKHAKITSCLTLSTTDATGDGYSWDATNLTLTLNGIDLEPDTSTEMDNVGALIFTGLTTGSSIKVVIADGSVNTIKAGHYTYTSGTTVTKRASFGIFSQYALTFTGSGTLNTSGYDLATYYNTAAEDSIPQCSYGLGGVSVTLGTGDDNPQIVATGGKVNTLSTTTISVGIMITNFTINSGSLTGVSQSDNYSYGLYSSSKTTAGTLTLNKGNLILEGKTAGLYFPAGLTTSGTLTAYGSAVYQDLSRTDKATYDSASSAYLVSETSSTALTVIFQGPEIDLTAYGSNIPCLPASTYTFNVTTYLSDFSTASSFSLTWYADALGAATATAPDSTEVSLDITSLTKTGQKQTMTLSTYSTTAATVLYVSLSYGTVKSNIIMINIVKLTNDTAPTLTIDYESECIKDYSESLYEYSLKGDYSDCDDLVNLSSMNRDISLDSSLTKLVTDSAPINLFIRYKATSQYQASPSQTIALAKRPAKPTSVTFQATSETGGTISGLSVGSVAYSLDMGGTWVTATAATAEVTVAENDMIYARVSPVAGTSFASEKYEVCQVGKIATPAPSYDNEGTISGLTANSSYLLTYTDLAGQTQTATIKADGDGKIIVSADSNPALFGGTVTSIQAAADSTSLASAAFTPAADSYVMKITMATPAAVYSNDNFTLTGLKESASYTVRFSDETTASFSTAKGQTSYDLTTNDDALGKSPVALSILKTDDRYRDSSYEAITSTAFIKRTFQTPSVTIDYENEALTGLTASGTYTITVNGTATDYTADADGKIAIDSSWFGTASSLTTLTILQKSTDANKYISSAEANVSLTGRPDTPSSSALAFTAVSDGNIQVSGVTSQMEYMATGSSQWTAVSGTSFELPQGTTFALRIRAVKGTSPASEPLERLTPSAMTMPSAAVDLNNGELTGLTASASYKINGESYTADANGMIPIQESWYGTAIKVVTPAMDTVIDSAPEVLTVETIADKMAAYASAAKAEMATAAGDSAGWSAEMTALISLCNSKIDAISASGVVLGVYEGQIDSEKSDCLLLINFQAYKDSVSLSLDNLGRECSGKATVQPYIDAAKAELATKDYGNSTYSDLDQILNETKTTIDLNLNKTILPNRLKEEAEELENKFTYDQTGKDQISALIASYASQIASAATTADQQALYQKARSEILAVKTAVITTPETKTSESSQTSEQNSSIQNSQSLTGEVKGGDTTPETTLTIILSTDTNGQQNIDILGLEEDYKGTVEITATQVDASGLYEIGILLPSSWNLSGTYKVVDSQGNVILATVDSSGYLRFQAHALGRYQIVEDYEPIDLSYIIIPLMVFIVIEAGFALVVLDQLRGLGEKTDKAVKAECSLLPLGLVFATTYFLSAGTIATLAVLSVIAAGLLAADIYLAIKLYRA